MQNVRPALYFARHAICDTDRLKGVSDFAKVGIESVLPLINLGCCVAEIGSVANHRIHLGWDAVYITI